MEVIFSHLKQKDVINLLDGKNLGKICDLTFNFPEGCITGFSASGGRGFRFNKQTIFLPIKSVVKIGEDAVLVKYGKEKEDCPPPKHTANKPPNNCPPNRPQPPFCPSDRRGMEEYE